MGLGAYLGSGTGITKGLWRFNGNSNDSSGNGYNLTNNGMQFSIGLYGQATDTAGTTSRYLYLASACGISYSAASTFSIWVKMNADFSSGNKND